MTQKQRTAAVRCFASSLLFAILSTSSEFEPAVHLVFLGDVMLGRGVAEAHGPGDWESTLQSLAFITRSADLAAANLESPIGCEASTLEDPRSLAAPPEAVAALSSAGMDILSTVNNHARDAGERGAQCTKEILSSQGIFALNSPSIPLEISVHGIQLLFLAIDFTGDSTWKAVEDLERRVRRSSDAGTIVVVSLHWGMEYQAGHDEFQKQIARRLAAAGADILWGHHPHVVQETEWMDHALILYSLGNAVFDQHEPEPVRQGELVWVKVDRRGVRFFSVLPFGIDPRLGKTGPPAFFSLRTYFAHS